MTDPVTAGMTVAIRQARSADVQVLPAVERDAGRSFLAIPDLAWIARDEVTSAEEHLAQIAAGTIWVADDAAAGVVGFLTAEVIGNELHIWEMAVLRGFQQRGVGARLLAAVADHGRVVGLAGITLTTFRYVAWNAPFYARNGFEIANSAGIDPRLAELLRREADRGMPRRCAMRQSLAV